MSTVGYGDISCKTTFGRIFIIIFIFGALVSTAYLLTFYVLHYATNFSAFQYTFARFVKRLLAICRLALSRGIVL